MKAFLSVGVNIIVSVFMFKSVAYAQPGSLDITFNPGTGPNLGDSCIALQTNGQIVVGGEFTIFNGVNRSRIARLNSDGSLDSSFDPGVGPNLDVNALAVQADGKILIGGLFTSINGLRWNQPARLRPDGSVDISFDTSFADGFGTSGTVMAMALQADGKIIIGGSFTSVSGTNMNYIARLNTNGTLDATFNPGTGANNYVNAVGLQSNGQVIIGGNFNNINGIARNYLARLNTDGSVDAAFNAPIADGNVSSLAVTPEDEIVIGGSFTSINGYSRNYIARLNADGSVDTASNPGLGAGGYVTSVSLQADGKIIIPASIFNRTNCGGLARLTTNGTLDVTFNPSIGTGSLSCVVSQPDGKTLIGGAFQNVSGTNINSIARLNGDNSPTTNLQFMASQLYFGAYLNGTVSNSYRVEWTSQFNTPSLWTPLFNVMLQTNPQFIIDTNPPNGQRFYRAVGLP